MTQREITVRLCEAYIKSGKTVDLSDVIKIANYIMAHTSEYAPCYSYLTATTGTNDSVLYTSTCSTGEAVKSASSVLEESENITL